MELSFKRSQMKRFHSRNPKPCWKSHKKGGGSLKCVQEDHLGELLKVQIPWHCPCRSDSADLSGAQ